MNRYSLIVYRNIRSRDNSVVINITRILYVKEIYYFKQSIKQTNLLFIRRFMLQFHYNSVSLKTL